MKCLIILFLESWELLREVPKVGRQLILSCSVFLNTTPVVSSLAIKISDFSHLDTSQESLFEKPSVQGKHLLPVKQKINRCICFCMWYKLDSGTVHFLCSSSKVGFSCKLKSLSSFLRSVQSSKLCFTLGITGIGEVYTN